MEGYISYSQLGQLIAFLVVVAAGGYAIVTLRNLNAAVKVMGAILKENQEALNQAIPNMAAASKNVVAITNDLMGETSKAIETADQIATYAMVIGETAQTLANLFSSSKKS